MPPIAKLRCSIVRQKVINRDRFCDVFYLHACIIIDYIFPPVVGSGLYTDEALSEVLVSCFCHIATHIESKLIYNCIIC